MRAEVASIKNNVFELRGVLFSKYWCIECLLSIFDI